MAYYFSEPSRTFGEYLLVPGYSSSECVPTAVSLKTPLVKYRKGEEACPLEMNIPMVSAIMQSVSGEKLAIALAKQGGVSFIYGSQTIEQEADMVRRVKAYKKGFVNIQGVPFSSVVKTAENTGNDRHALRDVAMSDRDVLRRAADLALNDRKMNFTQADRERLKIFKKRLDILDEKQTQRQGYLQAKRDILSNSARLF